MSGSSGSSLCGDDDHELLGGDDEEIDFYAILNVPTDATEDEITKAYRKRCLIFHPDRHVDEEDKKAAEKIFVTLKRAHETLIDPKQRAIYDALGVQGLDAHGWQLVSRSANPDNIRREYEFLQRLREQELMLQRTHPSSNFHVRTTLAGMFMKNPEYRYGPQLLGISISQGVDCPLTNKDRFGLVGRVRAGNGRGDGSVSAVWKRSQGQWSFENTATVSADSLTYSVRAGRSISPRSMVIVQPSLQWLPLQQFFQPSVAFIFSRQLLRSWQGSIVLNATPTASSLSTNVVYTENNQPKVLCNIAVSVTNPHVRLVYFSRRSANDSVTELACTVSPFGIAPSIQAERRLSRFTRVGCSLSFLFPSCTLTAKFKAKSGGAAYEWSIILCDDKEEITRSFMFGVVVPLAVVQIGRVVFRKYIDALMGLFEDSLAEREVDLARQEESERVINLMRPTAERIKREETERHGVIIIEAKYGQTDPGGSRAYPVMGERSIDVSVPLQSMVHDSTLRIYSVKSQLPGFYDPAPGDAKVLLVKYRFRDEMHAVCLPDDAPLTIPMRKNSLHRLQCFSTPPRSTSEWNLNRLYSVRVAAKQSFASPGIVPRCMEHKVPYPEAPPQETAASPPYPVLDSTQPLGAPAPQTSQMHQATSSAQPTSAPSYDAPPSYQDAMNLPTAAPGHPAYQPQTNPAYPKYPQSQPVQGVPPPPGYPIGYGAYPANPLPQPQPAYPVQSGPIHIPPGQPTAVIVNVTPAIMICAHCGGSVVKETDLCCLLCLVFLTIFTFPFGLVFLCCIPCTVRKRCINCSRVV